MLDLNKYLSVKWLKGGRSYPELDCFGIVNEIRRDMDLPEWPDFAGVTKDENGLDHEARKLMVRLRQCEPQEGAGIACYSGSVVTHVGIVVCIDGQLVAAECNPKTNVTFLPLARFIRRFAKVEFWL
ncbi:nitrite transporter [Lelliottia sp. V89_10]|uniref:nitrite transporter n=1 Tax=Lelliottia wanjuensis TaxID=3050585 RepID=UPI00249EBEF8|nr:MULTISPECIES: nitrite transporter [unclassified Lelliottia]MDI3359786.1 nitrite transporter [Lelliottia sp. V89_13]MDK9548744.1 nitrite transporter [Lelliottia sp. V89_5]MDK9597376.1 nitrite transporter [Lelliottia sp. V89_10]